MDPRTSRSTPPARRLPAVTGAAAFDLGLMSAFAIAAVVGLSRFLHWF